MHPALGRPSDIPNPVLIPQEETSRRNGDKAFPQTGTYKRQMSLENPTLTDRPCKDFVSRNSSRGSWE
jgi:hypothetical protein